MTIKRCISSTGKHPFNMLHITISWFWKPHNAYTVFSNNLFQQQTKLWRFSHNEYQGSLLLIWCIWQFCTSSLTFPLLLHHQKPKVNTFHPWHQVRHKPLTHSKHSWGEQVIKNCKRVIFFITAKDFPDGSLNGLLSCLCFQAEMLAYKSRCTSNKYVITSQVNS